MNYLAHLHLGGDQPDQLLGSLLGDFVKGLLKGQWPEPIEHSIQLHRRIDAFTDSHELVAQARERFSASQRRYAGLVLDVFFDHCLARDWALYSDKPLTLFSRQVYQVLDRAPQLPAQLALLAPRMISQDWLGSYREFAVMQQVIASIDRRLSRPGLLAGMYTELERLYEPLSEDFRQFYPQLQAFAGQALHSANTGPASPSA